MGSPMITSNPKMQESDIGFNITLSDVLESFSSSKKGNEKQESHDYMDSYQVFSAPHDNDNMQVLVSLNEVKSQAHESQSNESCNPLQSNTFNGSNILHPLSKTPAIDVLNNLTLIDPLPKLGFEKKSMSPSMYEATGWSSPFSLQRTFEKEQSQQISCNMEVCAFPPLNAHQKAHSQQLYVSPLAHKELDLEKNHDNVAISINESHSIFKTKVIGCGGAILDANQNINVFKGPEVEALKDSELIILPMDRKWPFLLRFPICCFAINLGLGSQAILWKILATQEYTWFMQVPTLINLVLWCIATMTLIIIFTIYALKVVFYFEAIRREFNHPIRVNFFFVPWATCILLILGAPPSIATYTHSNIWILFTLPILILNLKIYGDWLSGRQRHLCKVANPSTHLSIMGNFMGALLIGTIGYMELALFFWSIGFVHYLVLLVTLYQRLPSAMVLPKELHPIFFLFVALPCSASVSWAKIMGEFNLIAKMIYFFAMFLFFSLVARFKIFYGLRFNIAWWAYTFPLTVSAIATLEYSFEVKHFLTQTLATLLIIVSSLTVFSLTITTLLHTFLWNSMFPNDMVIAISQKEKKTNKKPKKIPETEHH